MAHSPDKPSLHWFSPLPPARTDIANYTARVLPALAARAQVTLWTDQARWDRSLERHAEVRRFWEARPDWVALNRSDGVFYNIGNDIHFHREILRVSERHRGIVILHDLSVHELLTGYYHGDRESYLATLRHRAGPEAVALGRRYLNREVGGDEVSTRAPMTAWPLEAAHGVVIHNTSRLAEVAALTSAPVLATPLPIGPCAALPPAPDRTRRVPPYRLVLFGFLNSPNRRLESFLEAWATFPRRASFRLDLVGQLKQEKAVRALLAQLGLASWTRLHGFVSEEGLRAVLDEADLAVNLRYPTRGESSGAQLRIWEHALPGLVTRDGWFASLPEDAVAFVDPTREREDLHRHLAAFLDDPARFRALGHSGRRFLEHHHGAESFADHLLAFLPNARAHRAQSVAETVARRWTSPLTGAAGSTTRGSRASIAPLLEALSGPR